MTASARPSQLHIPHQISLAVRSGNEILAVTVTALITCVDVELVTEKGIGIKINIFYLVTPGATAGDIKGSFAIMAATAGETALHLLHGNMGIVSVSLEEFYMTICAAEEGKVKLVAEYHSAEIRNIYWNVLCQMTSATLGETKRTRIVMTLAARLPLFHLGHRDNRIFLADFIKCVMTERTVIAKLL